MPVDDDAFREVAGQWIKHMCAARPGLIHPTTEGAVMVQNPRVRVFDTATKPVVVVDRLQDVGDYPASVMDGAVVLAFTGEVDVDPADLAGNVEPQPDILWSEPATWPKGRVAAGSLRRSDLPWMRKPGEGTAVGEPERVIDWGSQPPQGGVK
jgi:hypothetical protein